jgi:hypothetical protein
LVVALTLNAQQAAGVRSQRHGLIADHHYSTPAGHHPATPPILSQATVGFGYDRRPEKRA